MNLPISVVLLIGCLLSVGCPANAADDRPTIIVILLDDMG